MSDKRVFELLAGVSRTFNLSIRALKGGLASDVALAYLVCRLLDTVEDDASLPAKERATILKSLARALEDPAKTPETLRLLKTLEGKIVASPNETELLAEADSLFLRLEETPESRARVIRAWSSEMARGMAEFVSDHAGAKIKTIKDLYRYCYIVAGTVGGLLTELFVLFGNLNEKRSLKLKKDMESFGRGLQLVNIIKDCGKDRELGRGFIPHELLEKAGLTRDCQEDPSEVFIPLIAQASKDLDAAVAYISVLPRRLWRARLFCVYPVVFARQTLALLAAEMYRLLYPEPGPKISRGRVRRSLVLGLPAAFSNLWLRFECRRRRIKTA